jgi:hypothetical protein
VQKRRLIIAMNCLFPTNQRGAEGKGPEDCSLHVSFVWLVRLLEMLSQCSRDRSCTHAHQKQLSDTVNIYIRQIYLKREKA